MLPNTWLLRVISACPPIRSKKFFHAEADQTECLSARVLAGVEERQDKRQRRFFEPAQGIVIDGDAVLQTVQKTGQKTGGRLSNLANLANFCSLLLEGIYGEATKLLAPGVLYHVIVRGNHGQKTGHTIAGQVLHCDIEPYWVRYGTAPAVRVCRCNLSSDQPRQRLAESILHRCPRVDFQHSGTRVLIFDPLEQLRK